MVMRNHARALAELNRIDEAEKTYKELIDRDPTDDQSYLWYSGFLTDQDRHAESYALSEKAILADPDDPRLYIHLGIDVFNHGYHRTASGSIEGPEPGKVRPRFATPFLLKALEVDPSPVLVHEVVRILVRGDAIPDAEAIAAGKVPDSRHYDTTALDWITEQLAAKDNLRGTQPKG